MKTVAFLQNMWVRDPERVKRMMAESPHGEKFRRRLIATALFGGCLTGRRLRAELGDLCDTIIWEESSREILGDPKIVPTADLDHMMKVVATENPKLVVTFGKVATEAFRECMGWLKPKPGWISSPHPAARSVLDQATFRANMVLVRTEMR